MTTDERKALNAAATRAGVNRETFGEWMNIFVRFARMGHHDKAARAAAKALQVHADWPHLFADVSAETLDKARAYATGE